VRKPRSDEGYAAEQLVTELGSAILAANLALTPEPREDHAAYIGSWLKVLRDDKRAIFTAATHGQRAVDFLHGLQSTEDRQNPDPPTRNKVLLTDVVIFDITPA